MYFQRKIIVILIVSLTLFLIGCGFNKNEEKKIVREYDVESVGELISSVENIPDLSDQIIESILNSFPSPVEISYLLKAVGTGYSNNILNPANNKNKYITSYKKAINLGTYGADLGYTNIYAQRRDVIKYLNLVYELANEISIGHVFDFNSIKRVALNSENLDSLLYMTTLNYERMNKYLREQDQLKLSVLMLTGGWLESIYILSQVAKQSSNDELKERVGEQKITLDNIMLLLSVYQVDPDVRKLLNKFMKLKNLYDQVEIVYHYAEPDFTEVDGKMVVVDNSTTTINISDELFMQIIEMIELIRSGIIT